MNDGADLTSSLQDVAVEAPFARWPAAAEPAAPQIHQGNVVGRQRFIGHPRGTHEEGALIATYTDVARFPIGQAATLQLAAAQDDGFTKRLVGRRAVRSTHGVAPW